MPRSPVLLSLALLAACGDPAPELFQPATCEELHEQLEGMALREESYARVMGFDMAFGMANETSLQSRGVDFAAEDAGGAAEYSETNVQEAGVDEADIVKTDGQYVYTLSGGHAVISLAYPADQAQVLAAVDIDGLPTGLYLYGDKLVTVSQLGFWGEAHPRSSAQLPAGERSLVTVVDIADPSLPVVEREVYVAGSIWDTRRVDNELLLVSYYDAAIDTGGWNSTLAEAKRIIREAEVEDWLPWVHDSQVGAEGTWSGSTEPMLGCSDLWMSKRETGTFFSVVASVDLDDPSRDIRGQGVVGAADTLYATEDSLYIAYSEAEDGLFASLDDELDTIVHRFDSTPAQTPTYTDTARLIGIVPDQFAFSEQGGVLRVATSDPDGLTTRVSTLGTEGGQLELLDTLTGLAPGEVLYSARFVGDTGYLVTYVASDSTGPEIVTPDFSEFDPTGVAFGDPLFTIDLSDPRDIRVLGELQLNGWSDYIHPLGDDHLITVGMDGTPGESDWRVAVSVFDVSDLDNPVMVDRHSLNARSSEAQTDHHAFNYFASRSVLAIPADRDNGSSVLELLHVDTDGIEPVGTIGQAAIDTSDPWCARMRRSVFLDDTVWAVSEAGMVAVSLQDPDSSLAALTFPVDPCETYYGYYY